MWAPAIDTAKLAPISNPDKIISGLDSSIASTNPIVTRPKALVISAPLSLSVLSVNIFTVLNTLNPPSFISLIVLP